MDLTSVFHWFSGTWAAKLIGDSIWIFPAIEAVHIVALTVLLGAILFMDLQMLGFVRRDTPVGKLSNELDPWVFSSLIIILLSGFLLFSSEAMKLYFNVPFQVKMIALLLAIVFHFTVHRWIVRADSVRSRPVWSRVTAVISIMLWLTVGFSGRAIGFF